MLKRTILLASALAPALLLGACGGTLNRGLESVHQPVVSRTDYVFDVNTSGNGLAPGEEQRLAGWMASLRLGYGDHVAIDDPHPYGSGVHDTVAAQIARYGLLLSDDTPVTGAPVAPGTARIVISRMKATVPGCPDFTREGQPEFNSNTSSNLGCAVNSNLAAMVANPADLVRGQPGADSNDNLASSKAIDTYRKAPTTGSTGLKSESTGAK
jgi:pilus assembly protein CpaD